VATFAQVSDHEDSTVHRIAGTTTNERMQVGAHSLTDTPQELLELRNATIVPGGGIVWNGFWINGLDIHYYSIKWASADWRPGDFNETDQTIEIAD
jgi:hypothetical protein